jgi:hypothetical protein
MSTPTAGVQVTLTDGEHELRYSNRALMAIERVTGLDVNAVAQGPRLTALVTLVWAGLLHEERGLSVDDVADLIDLSEAAELGEVVGKAVAAALPKSGGRKPGKARARSKATG